MCAMANHVWWPEDNCQESVLFFHHVSPGIQLGSSITIGSKHFSPLSYLTGPGQFPWFSISCVSPCVQVQLSSFIKTPSPFIKWQLIARIGKGVEEKAVCGPCGRQHANLLLPFRTLFRTCPSKVDSKLLSPVHSSLPKSTVPPATHSAHPWAFRSERKMESITGHTERKCSGQIPKVTLSLRQQMFLQWRTNPHKTLGRHASSIRTGSP